MSVKCWCQHCGYELDLGHTGKCPSCGQTGKHCDATAHVAVGILPSVTAKAKAKKGGKIVREITQRGNKKSLDAKNEHVLVDEIQVVDKEASPPMWHQVVKDSRTGEVTHEEHVPLDQHRQNRHR